MTATSLISSTLFIDFISFIYFIHFIEFISGTFV